MSSKIITKLVIDVNNGDVFDEMRLLKSNGEKGRSNTGTYFLCSAKDFVNYEHLFQNCKSYYFDINKIAEYKILFKKFYFPFRESYSDNMEHFEEYCDILIKSYSNSISGMSIRNNDVRYFLRFNDNNELLVKAFRHILYGKITSIVLEFCNNECYVYPIIKQEEKLYFN